MNSRRTHFLTLSIAGLVMTGCSSTHEPSGVYPSSGKSEKPSFVIGAVTKGADIKLPLDAYIESPEQAQVNDLAVQQLAYSCMKDQGFEWPEPERGEQGAAPPMNARRYGVIESSEVRKWGYHPPFAAEVDSSVHGDAKKEFKPDGKAIRAYTGRETNKSAESAGGSSTAGCLGRAQRQVFGENVDNSKWMELLKYHSRSFTDAGGDVRVIRAMAHWRTCMKSLGYQYGDIWSANNDPRWQSRDVSRSEIAVAEDDVKCKQESRVPGIILAVETELQTNYIRGNAAEFSRIKNDLRQVFQRSLTVVGATSQADTS